MIATEVTYCYGKTKAVMEVTGSYGKSFVAMENIGCYGNSIAPAISYNLSGFIDFTKYIKGKPMTTGAGPKCTQGHN